MKKMIIATMMTLALVAFGVATAEAANPANISVTVTITASGLSVSLNNTSWPIGPISELATPDTLGIGPNYFIATNDRNDGQTENLAVTVGNSSPSSWIAATSAGTDQFAMKVSITGAAPFNLDASTGASIATGLAAGGTQSFDLQFLAPTSTDDGGTPQTITVTVTAS